MCTKVGELVTVLEAPSVETVFSAFDDKAESLSTSFRRSERKSSVDSIGDFKGDRGGDSVGSFCRMRLIKFSILKLSVAIA